MAGSDERWWTGQREEAALLSAQGGLRIGEIARRVGATPRVVGRWRQRAAFRQRVAELTAQMRRATLGRGIAEREERVAALNDRWARLQAVMEARAADSVMAGVPGGATGLLVRTLKTVGVGHDAAVVEEYGLDLGLLRELREHERQAAQELGEWQDKRDGWDGRQVWIRLDAEGGGRRPDAPP